jgi:CrcB protein
LFIFVGFFGGFTTFSTFGLETMKLLQNGQWKIGILNILLSNLLGITLVFAGIFMARLLINFLHRGTL